LQQPERILKNIYFTMMHRNQTAALVPRIALGHGRTQECRSFSGHLEISRFLLIPATSLHSGEFFIASLSDASPVFSKYSRVLASNPEGFWRRFDEDLIWTMI
jgi:hypothetical protein